MAISIFAHREPLEALKVVYQKHVVGDQNIGWDELGDMLCNVLSNEMGEGAFCRWADALKEACDADV